MRHHHDDKFNGVGADFLGDKCGLLLLSRTVRNVNIYTNQACDKNENTWVLRFAQ